MTKAIVIQAAMPPVVKVVVNQQPDSATVEVQATATPTGEDPVKSMQLLIDGRPEGPPHELASADGSMPVAQQQSWKVNDLPPGEHSLSVRADTDKSYGLGQAPAMIVSPGKSTSGKLYVLAVGISAYQQPGLRLSLAATDARAIAEALQKARPAAVQQSRNQSAHRRRSHAHRPAARPGLAAGRNDAGRYGRGLHIRSGRRR